MRIFFTLMLIILATHLAWAQTDDGRTINVPVVFHIIYTDTLLDNGRGDQVINSQFGNSTTRIPREKILAELQDLDQDFQQKNPDISDVIDEYKPAIGNPRMHFDLEDIIYIRTTESEIYLRNNSEMLHQLSPMIDPKHVLNVYIGRLRVSGSGSEGVTNVMTDVIDWSVDAVNLNYSWVGLHYRLLSHEVGHWLGLWHIDSNRQLTIDHIDDIPIQTSLTQVACVICSRPGVRVIRRQRNRFNNPNTNNFMDYSGCRRMFSLLQRTYMRNLVINLRKDIWNNSPIFNH